VTHSDEWYRQVRLLKEGTLRSDATNSAPLFDSGMRFPSNPVLAPRIQILVSMINEFGRIMQQEGVPEETRKRVIHTILFGTPEAVLDPKASIRRGLEDYAAGRIYENPDFPPWVHEGDA